MKEEIIKTIKSYKREYELKEIGTPLILIAELLASIDSHLENISNKMWE